MISIHNSENELAQKPELIQKLGIGQFIYQGKDGDTLPFCQYMHGADKPGKFILVCYFHGAGSRGNDNFLQVRIGAPPLASYCERHGLKVLVIMPQCRENCKWVDVPWESESHTLPPEPSRHMKLALALLDAKLKEFDIDRERIYALGMSMGGYAVFDMVSRRPELFAAAASMCGGGDTAQAPNLRDTAFYLIHGDVDAAVPVVRSRNMAKALRDAGNPNVVYHELAGVDHDVWDPFFADDEGLDFLFAQKRTLR